MIFNDKVRLMYCTDSDNCIRDFFAWWMKMAKTLGLAHALSAPHNIGAPGRGSAMFHACPHQSRACTSLLC